MGSTAVGRLASVIVVYHDRKQPAQTWSKTLHFGVDKILDKKKLHVKNSPYFDLDLFKANIR